MEYHFRISLLKDRRRWRQDLFLCSNLCCYQWWGWLPLWEWNRGERRSVKRQAYWRMLRGTKTRHQIHWSPFTKRSVERIGNVNTEYSIILASKKKPVLHKQYGCGGTSIRRHGKEDAQVTERRRGLPCCYYKIWDWLPLYLFEIASHD